MARPTQITIDTAALLHNLKQVKNYAPGKKIIAMVKANAYGCGLAEVVPTLKDEVDAFGVACLEEAMLIRKLGAKSECILFQGVFSPEEFFTVAEQGFQCVLHHAAQLSWLLNNPLPKKIKIWVKVDTGMHRLGFAPEEIFEIFQALQQCSWVEAHMGLITHLACADEPDHLANYNQLQQYYALQLSSFSLSHTIANSAAIIAFSDAHADYVRPGIMLYGVSPFSNQTGVELNLEPVLQFTSAISVIHHYPPGARIGYGGTWQTPGPAIIGVVAAGYGDGYPRQIAQNTPVWVKGYEVPIVGRVSMDMLTVDLTQCPDVQIGDKVELWGKHIPVEKIALSAGTIAYELLCRFSARMRL